MKFTYRKSNLSVELDVGEKLKAIGLSYNQMIKYLQSDETKATGIVLGVDNNDKLWIVSPDTLNVSCLKNINLKLSLKEQNIQLYNPSFSAMVNICDKNNPSIAIDLSTERLQKLGLHAGGKVLFQKTGKTANVIGLDKNDGLHLQFDNGDIGTLWNITSTGDIEKIGILPIQDEYYSELKLTIPWSKTIKSIITIQGEKLRQYNLTCGQEMLTPVGKAIFLGLNEKDQLRFITNGDNFSGWDNVKDIPTMHEMGIFTRIEYDTYMNSLARSPKRLTDMALEYITSKKYIQELAKTNKRVPFFSRATPKTLDNLSQVLEGNNIDKQSSAFLMKSVEKGINEETTQTLIDNQNNLNKRVEVLENQMKFLIKQTQLLLIENQELKKLIMPSDDSSLSEHNDNAYGSNAFR